MLGASPKCEYVPLILCNRSITLFMFSIKSLSHFDKWLARLPNASVRGVIVARVKRLERGLMGDVQPVGDKVFEMRIHFGAGWRLYFVQPENKVIVLLTGGSKRTQRTDIKRAKALAALLD